METLVPYANYRGAVIDEHGKTWLALDTSIKVKGYTWTNPEDIPEGFDLSDIKDIYLDNIHDDTPLEFLESRIQEYLDQNQPGTMCSHLLLSRIALLEEMKNLPASLQFAQIAVTNEYTAIPDELMHKVRFKASDPIPEPFSARGFDSMP